MRLVIDLQGAQGDSRGRGIGRLSQELARAMVCASGDHEPIILLNEAMPDSAEILGDTFARLLPRKNIRSWRGLTDCSYFHGSLERRRASEVIRAQVIAGLNPDLVHVASVIEGAGDDVIGAWPVSHRRLPVVATFYDAIPLVWKSEYLQDPERAAWYFRHLHELRQCTALLAISESSRREAIDHLGCEPSYAFNISAGFDAEMFRPQSFDATARAALLARHGLREGFVLFVGAGDPRKNDLGLLQAYARLSPKLRARHQLVIVGSCNPTRLTETAGELGIRQADLVLPSYIPEADLPGLYALCRCFVMPSKHEGFGLPALEAMACGAAVIASRSTSLPEVVGLDDALFDPYRPEDIAGRLERVLTDAAFRTRLVQHGLTRAAQFTWAGSAQRAWAALEEVQCRHPACLQRSVKHGVAVARKPSLAFVGPLPPDASGIADYARDLLPSLDAYYDITLVTRSGVVDDPTLHAVFPVLDEHAFVRVAHQFDRIVYQAGNSEFHIGIFDELLPRHPGVVVLHDAFLSNILLNVSLRNGDHDALARTLFDSHGWPALQLLREAGVQEAARRFPCLMPVFRHALGVLQHSAHARAIVERHVGAEAAEMVRLVPFARVAWQSGGRAGARRALDIAEEAPLICSFGIVNAPKRPLDVLAAWHEAFSTHSTALLAYVGGASPDMVEAVRSRAVELGVGERVIQTGRVDQETYRHWLDAADIAIQLRTESRGETSAAIADCMAVGLPVLANAHGATAELPPDTLVLLPDLAGVTEIGAALAALWADPARRVNVSAAAAAHVRTAMSPAVVARAYHEAIEEFYTCGKAAQLRAALPMLPTSDHENAARALAASFTPPGPGRLLLDVSTIVHGDAGTGIQRVVREVGQRVLAIPSPAGIHDMVRLDGAVLRYARRFAAGLLDVPSNGLPDLPVLAAKSDTLVLLDLYAGISPAELTELRRQRLRGARLVLVVYDLLPVQRPDWFAAEMAALVQDWLRKTLSIADAALCISRAVADELAVWLDACAGAGTPVRERPLDIGWFHLGSDFQVAVAGQVSDATIEAALTAARRRPTLLMVGTVEPRKGYRQALAAFEKLWSGGEDIGLTIVGKPGWAAPKLLERLRLHPEAGRRLHWLQQPSDAALNRLYAEHTGLLMASEGEGFGLPIVEAARAGLPVLARDIPVFREIAGEHALWFSGLDPEGLAAALREWRERANAGTLPASRNIPVLSWDDSVAAFLRPLQSGVWPICWMPPSAAKTPTHEPQSPKPSSACDVRQRKSGSVFERR